MGGRGKKLSICPPLVAGILVCVVSAKGGSADENDTGGFLLREPDPLGQGHRPSDLAEAIDRLEAAGYPVVFHIHDEIVVDAPPEKQNLGEMERLMSVAPEWADGLPLNADGWVNEFFKKD